MEHNQDQSVCQGANCGAAGVVEALCEAVGIDMTGVDLSSDAQPAASDHQCCGKCKQEDVGQTGEHPCSDCGLPLVHDAEPAKYTALEQRLAVDLQAAQYLLAVAVKKLGGVLEVSADDAIGLETAVMVGETNISTGNYVLKMTYQAPEVEQ